MFPDLGSVPAVWPNYHQIGPVSVSVATKKRADGFLLVLLRREGGPVLHDFQRVFYLQKNEQQEKLKSSAAETN